MRRVLLLSLSLMHAACGGGETPPARAPEATPVAKQREPARRPPPGTLWREDVDRALKRGLGYFLQHVAVEPVLDEGRFLGWELVEIVPPDYFEGVDLAPGDVVTSVNGLPIEREFQAHAAFESMRHAQELRVQLQRGGEPRTLVLAIVAREPGASRTGPGSAASAQPQSPAPTVNNAAPASSVAPAPSQRGK